VLVAKKRLDQALPGKAILMGIVSVLVALIRGSTSRSVHEDSTDYGTRRTKSSDYDYDYDYD
jgi:hypothetical protein